MKKHVIINSIIAAVAILQGSANAIVDFNDGGYHVIDYVIYDEVHVDYQTPHVGTFVELVDGGSIYGSPGLRAYEDSQVKMSGGFIEYNLRALGKSKVTVQGGTIDKFLLAYDNSQINFSGNAKSRYLYSYDNGSLTVSGGMISDTLSARDNSIVIISGGLIGEDLETRGNSQVEISDGSIGRYLMAMNNSLINISDGSIGEYLDATENSQINISGGTIGSFILAGDDWGLWDESLIIFEGSDFAINGLPIYYGEFASDYAVPGFDPWGNSCLTGTLTGTLSNNDTLNNTFYIFDDADITFIPEPGTIVLLGLGIILFRRQRQ